MARLVYLGTPEAAVPPLRTLVDVGHDVALVVTRADKRRSRRGPPQPSPVKAAAEDLGLRVTHTLDDVPGAGAELGVVVAFGRIIPEDLLARLPMVNVHFSLLPRWRGAAPVEWAILEGDAETGVCLMGVEAGLDTGPIYSCESTVIGEDENAEDLRTRLVILGCRLLEVHLTHGRAGLPRPRDQAGMVSYAEKIVPAQRELHWEEDALRLRRIVRIGRAWTTFRGQRLMVVSAAGAPSDGSAAPPGTLEGDLVVAGEGSRLRLCVVQPGSRRAMAASDWLHGVQPSPGERLGA